MGEKVARAIIPLNISSSCPDWWERDIVGMGSREIFEFCETDTVSGVTSPVVLSCGVAVELTAVMLIYGTEAPVEVSREVLLGTGNDVWLLSSTFMGGPHLSGGSAV